MINNHRATGRDRFLHGGAASLADGQVAAAKHPRQFVRPADDVDLAIANCLFDGGSKFIIAADGHCQVNIEIEKFSH